MIIRCEVLHTEIEMEISYLLFIISRSFFTYYSSNMPFLELMMRGNVALSYLMTTKICSIFPFELNLSYLRSPI